MSAYTTTVQLANQFAAVYVRPNENIVFISTLKTTKASAQKIAQIFAQNCYIPYHSTHIVSPHPVISVLKDDMGWRLVELHCNQLQTTTVFPNLGDAFRGAWTLSELKNCPFDPSLLRDWSQK